jgi:hypothetical protein
MNFSNIDKAHELFQRNTKLLTEKIRHLQSNEFNLVLTGSYGRMEPTSGSDLDYFILHKPDFSEEKKREIIRDISSSLNHLSINTPSDGGVFGSGTTIDGLATQIGGADDTNERITKRILFLTESRPLMDDTIYKEAMTKLIERYISNAITEHQLALFFLNDVIRYYRTVCVDFENKTVEGGKSWGIRNIKLIFSRKLLYFGGVLIAAETAQQTALRKREIVSELIGMTPLQRIQHLFGTDANFALKHYDKFLSYLDNPEDRSKLESTPMDRCQHDEFFRCAKNEGQHFSFALLSLLKRRYSEFHPIYRSLIL